MVIKLSICDDQESILLLLQKFILEISNIEEIPMVLDSFQNPAILLERVKKNPQEYDLVFLDIDMPLVNGIELGESLKSINSDVIIIYITAHDKYAYSAYQIRAFHYLMKPINKDKLKETFLEAVKLINKTTIQKDQEEITILNRGHGSHVPYNEIIYFEKNRNKVRVICKEKQYEYYITFKQLIKEIDKDQFVQCHQGYIINKEKISSYEKNTVILDQTIQIPVSKKNMNTIKKVFSKSLRS